MLSSPSPSFQPDDKSSVQFGLRHVFWAITLLSLQCAAFSRGWRRSPRETQQEMLAALLMVCGVFIGMFAFNIVRRIWIERRSGPPILTIASDQNAVGWRSVLTALFYVALFLYFLAPPDVEAIGFIVFLLSAVCSQHMFESLTGNPEFEIRANGYVIRGRAFREYAKLREIDWPRTYRRELDLRSETNLDTVRIPKGDRAAVDTLLRERMASHADK